MFSACSKRTDWPGVPYTQVRGYAYNLDGQHGTPLLDQGRLHPSVFDTNGVQLTPQQSERLLEAVARPHAKHPVMRCYFPRHGFVFYAASNQPVATVEICFECSTYRTSPPLSHFFDLTSLREVAKDVGLPVFSRPEDYQALKAQRQKQ